MANDIAPSQREPTAGGEPGPDEAPNRAYRDRKASAERRLGLLDRRSASIANLRTVAFAGAALLALSAVFAKLGNWSWYGAAACLVLFAFFAAWHAHIFRREAFQRALVRLNQRGIDRLTGAWQQFRETGERFQEADHLYSADLNVFGTASLFQLLNETGTFLGEAKLSAWLRAPADLDVLADRQVAVKELTPLMEFRQSLNALAQLASEKKADPSKFIEWAEKGTSLVSIEWARPLAWVLPLGTLSLYLLGRAGLVLDTLWWVGLGALLLLAALTRKPLAEAYQAISFGEIGFIRFEDVFATLESQDFRHPLLRRLSGDLKGASVSDRLRHFGRLFSFLELRQSPLMHSLIHFLSLWDVHWCFRLEKWRLRHGKEVWRWFENLAELEALCALATFAHDRPHYVYPELSSQGPVFIARQLGHPLLAQPVRNDVALLGHADALLITGSNMSGKSTLLRAMGTNAVLALAGSPVCAQSLRLSHLAVLTSMRVKDSLERGISYFYAEVQRIKSVLDTAAAAQGQAMFLLDEILLGTNSHERQIASREILLLLLRTGACGAVSTHDVSLASLEREPNLKIRNVHFRESIVDGRMNFDYRLREGVLESGNALRVLRDAGIMIPN